MADSISATVPDSDSFIIDDFTIAEALRVLDENPTLLDSALGRNGANDPLFNPIVSTTPPDQTGPSQFSGETSHQQGILPPDNLGLANNPVQPPGFWPGTSVPYSCGCCQVLREIIHTKGTCSTKLEIHGRLGLLMSHAILESRFVNSDWTTSQQYQMIDFCHKSMEAIKEYLVQYCEGRKREGYTMQQDPLLKFYEALCVGLSDCDLSLDTHDNLFQSFPSENFFQPSSSVNFFQPSPADILFQPSPAENFFQPSPTENLFQPSPVDNLFQPPPTDNLFQPSPTDNFFQPSPADNFFQTSPTNNFFQLSPADNSGEQLNDQAEAVNQSGAPRDEVGLTRSRSIAAQRQRTKTLTLKDLMGYFHLPIEDAANQMKVSPTVMKNICRKYGLKRWPHRKIKSIQKKISSRRASLDGNDAEEKARAQHDIESFQEELANIFTVPN